MHTSILEAIMAAKSGFQDLSSKLARLTYLKQRRDTLQGMLGNDLQV